MGRIHAGFDQGEDMQVKLQQVLQRLMEARDNMLLFIDELYDLMVSEGKNLSDAESIVRAYILSDAIQVIATTTYDRYYRFDDQDKIMANRFQPLMINEPDVKDTVNMLQALKQGFENFTKLSSLMRPSSQPLNDQQDS